MAKIKNFLAKIISQVLKVLLPPHCVLCQKEGDFLCEDCRALFPITDKQFCLCSQPQIITPSNPCQHCQKSWLAGLFFPLTYENELLKKVIHRFKYESPLRNLAQPLASFIIAYFLLAEKEDFLKEGILVPIPLERKRLRWRGFNQAEEIGKYVADYFQMPLITDVLLKIKKTLPQTELSGKERRENLQNAFQVKNQHKIIGKKIFLIDDIYTTGTTMMEAAKVLKKAGAKEVWGIVLARSIEQK